jgi:hypothetical protein
MTPMSFYLNLALLFRYSIKDNVKFFLYLEFRPKYGTQMIIFPRCLWITTVRYRTAMIQVTRFCHYFRPMLSYCSIFWCVFFLQKLRTRNYYKKE